MKIWIDADAAPRDVKEVVFRAARRLELETVLVANRRLSLPLDNPFVTTVRVDGGPDAADRHIAQAAAPGDLAVTADVPLAAMLVEKRVIVLTPGGEDLDAESIGERSAVRDLMESLRGAGVETGGPGPRSAKDTRAFASALDRALTRAAAGRR